MLQLKVKIEVVRPLVWGWVKLVSWEKTAWMCKAYLMNCLRMPNLLVTVLRVSPTYYVGFNNFTSTTPKFNKYMFSQNKPTRPLLETEKSLLNSRYTCKSKFPDFAGAISLS